MTKFLCTLSMLLSLSALADFSPYMGEPPMVHLTSAQQADVAAGKLVFLIENTKGEFNEGSVAFRVNAKPEKVWKVLADFSQYADWSYRVGDAKVYKQIGNDTIFVDFTTDRLSKHYYVMNKFPMKDWSTWATDHSRSNDCVLDTVGFWRVQEAPGNPNASDVIQYGKLQLTSLCANGVFGIGAFNARDMANTIHRNLKARAEAL
ncbi:MAG: SRPBCC family protein [Myxococcota bacterium]